MDPIQAVSDSSVKVLPYVFACILPFSISLSFLHMECMLVWSVFTLACFVNL